MKICCTCKKELEEKEFSFKNKARGILQSECRKCHKKRNREWYEKNREERISVAKNRTLKNRKDFAELKSTLKCSVCGENHPATLDFHHRDASKKDMNVGHIVSHGWKKLMEEIEKCDVLCANCHRKIHYEEKLGGLR